MSPHSTMTPSRRRRASLAFLPAVPLAPTPSPSPSLCPRRPPHASLSQDPSPASSSSSSSASSSSSSSHSPSPSPSSRQPPVPVQLQAKADYISRMRASLRRRCVVAEDPFWGAMQDEARAAAADEPLLASFMFATVLNHSTLQSALAFHLANKLASTAIPATQLMRLFTEFMDDACDSGPGGGGCDPKDFLRKDLLAVMERDPACTRFIDCLCYYKGFHALQAHRIAHSLWRKGRVAVAYHLQAQVSKELQVDIHPAAVIGPGAFFDHATGLVIGETAVIGQNVSMLHHVTLGGSGKKHGVRHPQIGDGVLLGAGATLLGDVHVGDGAQIGACSLVLEDIPAGATVVGVPARVVMVGDRTGEKAVPALDMKHERCLEKDTGADEGPAAGGARVPGADTGVKKTAPVNGADSASLAEIVNKEKLPVRGGASENAVQPQQIRKKRDSHQQLQQKQQHQQQQQQQQPSHKSATQSTPQSPECTQAADRGRRPDVSFMSDM